MTTSLFVWQRAVIASTMHPPLQLTAIRIGLDSTQSTGRNVVINSAQVAGDLSCSERTVWRRVQQLVEFGWLLQTAKPTYTGSGEKGRRARYCLVIPGQSSDNAPTGTAHDSERVVGHDQRDGGTRQAESSATRHRGLAIDSPSRLPKQPLSSATSTADDGTLSASDGFSSSSSDVAVEILASKLRRFTVLSTLRTDKLKPEQADKIRALIELHGDQRLVDNAMRTVRRDDPPQTIQAFLPGWSVIPRPGETHLAVVPDPCPQPGHSGTTRHCTQCASEQKAAHR